MQPSDISERRRDRHRVLELVELIVIEEVPQRGRVAELIAPLI